MTTLIIARHGNTFAPHETPTRVGARTDLPLVEKGEEQAKRIGRYLCENNMVPDVVYTSTLQRTIKTAALAIHEIGISNPVHQLDIFNEIDYGPDENKKEADVIARIGEQAILDWDAHAKVPDGWDVDPDKVIKSWHNFAEQITGQPILSSPLSRGSSSLWDDTLKSDETVLVVTSNGIARFAPYITGDFEAFRNEHNIKLSTGALGLLKHSSEGWTVQDWNIKP